MLQVLTASDADADEEGMPTPKSSMVCLCVSVASHCLHVRIAVYIKFISCENWKDVRTYRGLREVTVCTYCLLLGNIFQEAWLHGCPVWR